MCERAREIVRGDVNEGERVRIGENDMGKKGHRDEVERGDERQTERERDVLLPCEVADTLTLAF